MPRPSGGSPTPSGQSSRPTVLPKLVTDPIWSLSPWPVQVLVGGDSYEIPAHPAMAWLGVLMNETAGWLDLFPGLAGDDAEDALFALIATADVDMDEVVTAAKQALAVVSGRPWWVAVRLVHVAFASWDYVSGEVVFRGVDAVRLSLSAWLDAVFHIILRSMDSKDHTKFLAQLEMPPAEERASLPEPEMSADAFKALMR